MCVRVCARVYVCVHVCFCGVMFVHCVKQCVEVNALLLFPQTGALQKASS